jgi:hypothetical protein
MSVSEHKPSPWKPQSGRVTLFHSVPNENEIMSAIALYQEVWKSEPDSYQKQQSPFASSVAVGNVDGLNVSCHFNQLRIDFIVGPPPPSTPATQEMLSLIDNSRNFHQQLKRILERIRVNPSTIPATRVACWVQFTAICSNFGDANRAINSVFPRRFRLDLSEEEDFILQLNRPRQSASVEGVKMNFITKWAVERVQLLSMTMMATNPTGFPSGGASQLGVGGPHIKTFINPTIAFDNNNHPADRPLSGEEQFSLLEEALHGVAEGMIESNLEVDGF